jgi:hypothetical protein
MARVLAVLRLIVSSNFVGCMTGQMGRLFAFQNASRLRTGFPMGSREVNAADCGAALR